MYEIDKEAFGKFLAQQRKAKGYTQKALAEKLFVSDKAVSKWERSLSMPLFYWLFFATAGYLNLNNLNVLWILEIFLVLYLISLFAPMYYLGRKYQ